MPDSSDCGINAPLLSTESDLASARRLSEERNADCGSSGFGEVFEMLTIESAYFIVLRYYLTTLLMQKRGKLNEEDKIFHC